MTGFGLLATGSYNSDGSPRITSFGPHAQQGNAVYLSTGKYKINIKNVGNANYTLFITSTQDSDIRVANVHDKTATSFCVNIRRSSDGNYFDCAFDYVVFGQPTV